MPVLHDEVHPALAESAGDRVVVACVDGGGLRIGVVEHRSVGGEGESVGEAESTVDHGERRVVLDPHEELGVLGGPALAGLVEGQCADEEASGRIDAAVVEAAEVTGGDDAGAGAAGAVGGLHHEGALCGDEERAIIRCDDRPDHAGESVSGGLTHVDRFPDDQLALDDEAGEDVDPEEPVARGIPDRTFGEAVVRGGGGRRDGGRHQRAQRSIVWPGSSAKKEPPPSSVAALMRSFAMALPATDNTISWTGKLRLGAMAVT